MQHLRTLRANPMVSRNRPPYISDRDSFSCSHRRNNSTLNHGVNSRGGGYYCEMLLPLTHLILSTPRRQGTYSRIGCTALLVPLLARSIGVPKAHFGS